MTKEDQIKEWLWSDRKRMDSLKIAMDLGLNDWCLAAGFVRNMIWDKLHGSDWNTDLNDIDLIYYDPLKLDEALDKKYETQLRGKSQTGTQSDLPWSVKNQARMHHRNNDAPYASTLDAMSYWVEIETAIGVRLSSEQELQLIAPFGYEALFEYSITINPKRRKPEDFKQRLKQKHWLEKWPKLRVKR